jgi:hypothetical protein
MDSFFPLFGEVTLYIQYPMKCASRVYHIYKTFDEIINEYALTYETIND